MELYLAMSSSNKTSVSSSGRGTNKNKLSQQHGKSDHHQTKSSDSTKHDKVQVSNKYIVILMIKIISLYQCFYLHV